MNESKEKQILEFLKKHNFRYISFENSLDIIYDLFINDIIPTEIPKELYRIIGNYYNIKQNHVLMIKFYELAVEDGDSEAMFNLGLYYNHVNKYNEMFKYFLMAIKKGNYSAMHKLGIFTNVATNGKSYLELITENSFENIEKYR